MRPKLYKQDMIMRGREIERKRVREAVQSKNKRKEAICCFYA